MSTESSDTEQPQARKGRDKETGNSTPKLLKNKHRKKLGHQQVEDKGTTSGETAINGSSKVVEK